MPVRPRPILSLLVRRRRSGLTASTTCNLFATVQCESPFVATKQASLLKSMPEQTGDTTPSIGQLKRSYSVRTFGKSSSSLQDNVLKNYHANLRSLLKDSGALYAFRKFLASEFSEENLDFWCQCERYKKEKPSKQCKKAKKIFETFVKDNAPREINIDSHTKVETLNKLQNPDARTFESAQDKIYELMEKDSFPRFLSTKPSFKKRGSFRAGKRFHASASSSQLLEEGEKSKPTRLKRLASL